ncbi:N-6 DNA Methylase [Oligella ureolytica]|uniref:Eco57I restriction-modification methylase domain-containing protein n=1 Tax=Oligella ureolytica TaxID=90244 RepID=UPI000E0603B6|nr:N-6 DNA methylase [Oligella ureolytica]SUA58541.1 N-6 DNA Methylase [Oligella ureolytica]
MHNYIAPTLDRTLRGQLERAVKKARTVAEQAASEALNRLAVGEARPPEYLNEAQRNLRTRLRALGRQLGDIRHEDRHQDLDNLITSVAYEHWHRMLFARYLEQNHLLMYDQYTALTLEECNELVQEPDVARDEQERRCTTGWELAGVLASKMLPQIFRVDSPVFELSFAPEHQQALTNLVMGLNTDTFHASDSLGWVYQFWQSDNKERINKSGVKIGARELPAVTQLFTEPYMVSFLLDNALGAWWANKRLTEEDWLNAKSEQELRDKASIPGMPLEYLRFVQEEDAQGNKRWAPAAGTFNEWPKTLSELKTLDPSCGSGHFLVAALLMLVPMRMTLEDLTEREAVDAVLRDNIHGLELDQRCVELAAFALALTAWTYPNSGGYRALPEMQLACSGLSVKAAKEEWKQLGLSKRNLSIALDWLHQTFQHAPILGSLINPKAAAKNITDWDELSTALNQALTAESSSEDANHIEAAIVAQGLAKAAQLLAGEYQWVITNVPYLARGKQEKVLQDFADKYYPEGKNDLATMFLDRCLDFCVKGGVTSIVLPQNWLFLTSYRKFREKLLKRDTWNLVARLGARAFEMISGEVVQAVLITLTKGQRFQADGLFADKQSAAHKLNGLDVLDERTAADKAQQLPVVDVKSVEQLKQLENPDARIALEEELDLPLLKKVADGIVGLQTGDDPRYTSVFWELNQINHKVWEWLQNTPEQLKEYSGLNGLVRWEQGNGSLLNNDASRPTQGLKAVGYSGIAIHRMRILFPYHFSKTRLHQNVAIVLPKKPEHLPAIWCFCSSPDYNETVRQIDQSLKVTNATLVKVPFDLEHWTMVAEEQYPNGLPQPYSNDPTQWIFHGHPAGSVIWCENEKRTVEGELRTDDTVLQVAVARLLGYQWPAELDTAMELAPEQRAWVERCKALAKHADDDGIVCLAAVRGEAPAHQRIEALLETAYGNQWTTHTRDQLLKTVGSASIEQWLYNKFFEQHCKLFQNRPFIWHIWDGLKDGFSVLVNYHKLDRAGLERLIYTYLGDWIRTQQAGLQNGTDGAQERLAAAESLKTELEAILEGEKPYDIFVRWKPLAQQPIGWNPDLNDGVRLNIRPFMLARDVGRKDAGILRSKSNIHWKKDRGTDVESAPWYHLGPEYGGKKGDRINEHHLSLEEKRKARGE